MKIGTLNFHRSQNYGALLVTYSLLTYLKKIGIHAKPIDYFPEHHTSMYPMKNQPYDGFVDKYLRPFGSEEEEYDVIIYGADTIWEYYRGYGYDAAYWGSDRLKAKKRIAYSASGTMKNFSEESDELFRKYLNIFHSVSVREDVLAEYLRNLTEKPIFHTCDPTFLLSEEDYAKIMSERLIPGEYAVVYNRQLGTKLFEAARTVEEKTGLPAVVLKGDGCLYNTREELLRKDIGPSEFLSLIKYSSYVLAASFHAVAFSVIFKKQFHTIMKSGAERVESLLRKLGLQERRIEHTREITMNQPIDYEHLLPLKEYIAYSKQYLDTALQNEAPQKEAYIWGAAKAGGGALEYGKDRFHILGFIDKRADAGFQTFCSKPVLSPKQFFAEGKRKADVIVAVTYPAEVVRELESKDFCEHIYIFDGRSKENPFFYQVKEGEICAPEYMDKRFAEWQEYTWHYSKLSPFILQMFQTAMDWIGTQEKDIPIYEIGCGSGQFANMLFDNGYLSYTGIDFSRQAIELAKKANSEYANRFICGDAFECLSKYTDKEGLFVLFEVLEHMKKDVELLDMLPPGSKVVFSVPDFKSFNHIRTFASGEEIQSRYHMLKILKYVKLPANENADKVYHLVFAVKNEGGQNEGHRINR